MSTTRIALRQDILKKLYPLWLSVSTTSALAASPVFSDSKQNITIPRETFIGGWIYFTEDSEGGVDKGDTVRIIDVNASTGSTSYTFTVAPSDVYTAHLGGIGYELHYIFHPEDINDAINDIIRFGTRSTLSSLTSDTDTTVFERDVLVYGVMSMLKRRLAVGKSAFESAHLNEEAQFYEDKYILGLVRQGYEPLTRSKDKDVGN